ncbi:Alpha/Beta hydrolase protein [Hyaloraphidium curvatum]|nr:Alpha/Beta hydrolase protein [Hyaloraphidium curvatum]
MASDPAGPPGERILRLRDGRSLAYTECGDPAGRAILCFHGALGVGDFSAFSKTFAAAGYRVVAPTLPGWGSSSPSAGDVWAAAYFRDVAELLDHLAIEKCDAMGVSYGSLAALNAAANLPARVGRCLLMSGFAPFRHPGLDYSLGMGFQTKLTMGWFARANPWFARFTASAVRKYLGTPAAAAKFAQDNLAGQMNADEKAQQAALRAKDPSDPRLDPAVMGLNMHLSMAKCEKGYTTIPQNLWDPDLWGLKSLEEFPVPLYVTGATGDAYAPINLQRFLAKTAPKGTTKMVEHAGGHLSYSFLFEELFPPFAAWDGKGTA